MADDTAERKSSQASQWWYIEHLIAGLDAPAQIKLLLFLVHLHQNKKTGRAWASQETLAEEMNIDVRRVREHFGEAKRCGFVGVDRQRKGRQKQFNEYWLKVERLLACQRPDRHQTNQTDHRTPAPSKILN